VEAVNGIPQVGHEGHSTCCSTLDVGLHFEYIRIRLLSHPNEKEKIRYTRTVQYITNKM